MKFIDVSKLNELHEEFQKEQKEGESFQGFLERREDGEKDISDVEPCKKYLQQLHDEYLRYLLQCEDEDLRWFGDEHLKEINFWRKLLGDEEQLTMPEIKAERRKLRVELKLIELKTDGNCFEFLIHETVRNKILGWCSLPDVDAFKEYLKKNAFPEYELYSEQNFLDNVENASGFMRLKVARKETAEFILKMIYELFEI